MSNILAYAENELSLIGIGEDSTDKMNKAMHDHILRMVEVFSEEGHSGFSAAYAIKILEKLLSYKPLTPLTGEDDEWTEVSENDEDGKLFQNKRYFSVFKNELGKVWNIDGKVFVEPNGCSYTSRDSHVPVTFPYTPHTEYVNVDGKEIW